MKFDRVEIMAEVLDSVAETLNIPVTDIVESTLIRADLEADSMDIVTLMVLLDDKFDAEFDPENIPADDVSIGWVVDYVIQKLERAADSL